VKRSYNIVELIRKKRDGKALTAEEIHHLITSYTKDELPDYQMSAFLMASFLNGLNDEESAAFTKEMLHSGQVLDLSEIPGVKVDKHSTGGVGDKVSVLLAPIVAAAGVPVPMISGRGLGHTGGTLDKLESITGFNVNLNLEQYRDVLARHNMVLIGQTEDIAPADKRMYALRDVTATVECIPLIAGSIMSKKLAEGIDALVLDVKFGDGAFMKTIEDARKLAEKLVSIGLEFKKDTIAYLTNMEQPLGNAIGNWLEIKESIDGLSGNGPDDLMEVTYLLSGTMIYQGKKADSIEEGIAVAKEMVSSGKALKKLRDIVEEQDGDVNLIDHPETYPKASVTKDLRANMDGCVTKLDAFACGLASLETGAGRRTKEDEIDPTTGIYLHKKVGDDVKKGDVLATLYAGSEEQMSQAVELLEKAFTFSETSVKAEKMVHARIDKDGFHEEK
jgi:pyrimidine-nucleoside phosphorylase